MRENKRRPSKTGSRIILWPALLCGLRDKLYFCTTNSFSPKQDHYVCSNYKSNTGSCKIHYIREQVLYRIVLETIQRTLIYVRMFRKDFKLEMLAQNERKPQRRTGEERQKAISGAKSGMEDWIRIIQHIYEDNVLGRVTNEQKELAATIPEKKERLERLKSSMANVDAFIEKARRYTAIDELTPELLRLFIQRIEIGGADEEILPLRRPERPDRVPGHRCAGYAHVGGDRAPYMAKKLQRKKEIMQLLA